MSPHRWLLIAAIGFVLLPALSARAAALGFTNHTWVTGGAIQSSPAIGTNGVIYIGSADSNLYAFNPDGTTNWVSAVGGKITSSSPAIDTNGNIYVGTYDDRYLYSFGPTGAFNWSSPTASAILTTPALGTNGTIYVADSDYLYAFDPSGLPLHVWAMEDGRRNYSASPTLGPDGSIYIVTRNSAGMSGTPALHSFNPNGTTNWVWHGGTLKLFLFTPAIGSDGTIFIGARFADAYAVNPTGGLDRTWGLEPNGGYPDMIVASPTIASNGTIYISGYEEDLTNYSAVYSLNPNGATTNSSYDDSSLVPGVSAYYWIKAQAAQGSSGLSESTVGRRRKAADMINANNGGCDYDADGKADPAVYRTETGAWSIKLSASGYSVASASGFGDTSHAPVPADFDGDAKADPAIYNLTSGNWRVMLSSGGYGIATVLGFGGTGYAPVSADYDGDGLSDPAVYQESTGTWRIMLSGSGYLIASAAGFGGTGYSAVPGRFRRRRQSRSRRIFGNHGPVDHHVVRLRIRPGFAGVLACLQAAVKARRLIYSRDIHE